MLTFACNSPSRVLDQNREETRDILVFGAIFLYIIYLYIYIYFLFLFDFKKLKNTQTDFLYLNYRYG